MGRWDGLKRREIEEDSVDFDVILAKCRKGDFLRLDQSVQSLDTGQIMMVLPLILEYRPKSQWKLLETLMNSPFFAPCMALEITEQSSEAPNPLRQQLFQHLLTQNMYRLLATLIKITTRVDGQTHRPTDVPFEYIKQCLRLLNSGDSESVTSSILNLVHAYSLRHPNMCTNILSMLLTDTNLRYCDPQCAKTLSVLIEHTNFELLLGKTQTKRLSNYQRLARDGLQRIVESVVSTELESKELFDLTKALLLHLPFQSLDPKVTEIGNRICSRLFSMLSINTVPDRSASTEAVLISCLGGDELPDGSRSKVSLPMLHFIPTIEHIEGIMKLLDRPRPPTYPYCFLSRHYETVTKSALWGYLLSKWEQADIYSIREIVACLQGRALVTETAPLETTEWPASALRIMSAAVREAKAGVAIQALQAFSNLNEKDWLSYFSSGHDVQVLDEIRKHCSGSSKLRLAALKCLAEMATSIIPTTLPESYRSQYCEVSIEEFLRALEQGNNNMHTVALYGVGNLGQSIANTPNTESTNNLPFESITQSVAKYFYSSNEKILQNSLRAGAFVASLWQMKSSSAANPFIESFLQACKQILGQTRGSFLSRKAIRASTGAVNALFHFFTHSPNFSPTSLVDSCEHTLIQCLTEKTPDKILIATCRALGSLKRRSFTGEAVVRSLALHEAKPMIELSRLLGELLNTVNLSDAQYMSQHFSRYDWLFLYNVMVSLDCDSRIFDSMARVQVSFDLEQRFATRVLEIDNQDEL